MPTLERPNPYLALVGMHGPPEKTGLVLRESLLRDPIDGWDVEIANEQAVAQGVRYVTDNLALAFPGDRHNEQYERQRPAQILELARERRTVLEIHDRPHATGEYAVVGGAYIGDPLAVAGYLGIKHIVYGSSRRLVDYTLTTLAIEMCRDDTGDPEAQIADNVSRLRAAMGALATGTLPKANREDFTFYTYATGVRATRAKALGIEPDESCVPLGSVPAYVRKKLNLPPHAEYVFEGWNASGSSQGEWFGEILRVLQPKKTVDLTQTEYPTPHIYEANGHTQ